MPMEEVKKGVGLSSHMARVLLRKSLSLCKDTFVS